MDSLDSLIAADSAVVSGGVQDNEKDESFDWNTSTLHQIKVLVHRVTLKVIRNYPVTIGTSAR